MENAFHKILAEIYRIVSKKALAQEESNAVGPSSGKAILISDDAGKKGSCCASA